ncbi:hypothetical protein EKG38_10690 [Shewanella canadensis]|uniref:Uncharacterized protein n=1 Tax=Shewanella canadensis TaxID=271096 RepID=A0A431WTZ9_9GAMM|nr:hypothetical protein [Shewanella canadensis]RTR38639.1 hypothetical protein EKG38_10690 [Shewanella canadensis]
MGLQRKSFIGLGAYHCTSESEVINNVYSSAMLQIECLNSKDIKGDHLCIVGLYEYSHSDYNSALCVNASQPMGYEFLNLFDIKDIYTSRDMQHSLFSDLTRTTSRVGEFCPTGFQIAQRRYLGAITPEKVFSIDEKTVAEICFGNYWLLPLACSFLKCMTEEADQLDNTIETALDKLCQKATALIPEINDIWTEGQ